MSLTVNSIGANAQIPGIAADAFIPDQLVAGPHQIVTDTVTVAQSQLIPRGSVLGQITASGKYVLSTSGASDGSQNPSVIAADTIDASAGDAPGAVYIAGEFNGNALNLGAGITLAALKTAFRPLSIYIKSAVSAADPT